jgi:predicted GH43/DUF377 family glycosyl hydrolase
MNPSRRHFLQTSFVMTGSLLLSETEAAPQAELAFWDLFSTDYRKNCLAWTHRPDPAIPATGTSFKQIWTANPDYFEHGGRKLLYYRGNGFRPDRPGERHDRIVVAEVRRVAPDQLEIQDLNGGTPIVDVGAKGTFDSRDCLDPAAVAFNGKVWLYYSAIGPGPNSVGLAISDDGVTFKKHGEVLVGRAPEVLVRDRAIYMLYQKQAESYSFYLARSTDGIHFENVTEKSIFEPEKGKWDNKDVSTGRLFRQGDWTYLLYGASSNFVDQPDFFGLARSKDLIAWERHPGNPIFGCGPKGAEDGGAIWFPALLELPTHYVLLYEGSRGKYDWDLSSQICQAALPKRKIG